MRAVGVREPKGRPEVLEVPRPEPGEGEVLVRVSAAGLNPLDWKIADGMLEGALPYAFPWSWAWTSLTWWRATAPGRAVSRPVTVSTGR